MKFREGFPLLILNILFFTIILLFIYLFLVVNFTSYYDGLFVENLVIFVVSFSISTGLNLEWSNLK